MKKIFLLMMTLVLLIFAMGGGKIRISNYQFSLLLPSTLSSDSCKTKTNISTLYLPLTSYSFRQPSSAAGRIFIANLSDFQVKNSITNNNLINNQIL